MHILQIWYEFCGEDSRFDSTSTAFPFFLEGSVEETPGFGIGPVPTIPRERPSTMMMCVRGTSLAFLSAVITCHGTMSLLTTTSSPGIWVTTVVQ